MHEKRNNSLEQSEQLREAARYQLERMQQLIAQSGIRLFTDFGKLPYDKDNEWFLRQHFGLEEVGEFVELSTEPRERDTAKRELKISQLHIADCSDPDKILFSLIHDEPDYTGPDNFSKAPNFGMFIGPHMQRFTSIGASADEICSFTIIAPEEYSAPLQTLSPPMAKY